MRKRKEERRTSSIRGEEKKRGKVTIRYRGGRKRGGEKKRPRGRGENLS